MPKTMPSTSLRDINHEIRKEKCRRYAVERRRKLKEKFILLEQENEKLRKCLAFYLENYITNNCNFPLDDVDDMIKYYDTKTIPIKMESHQSPPPPPPPLMTLLPSIGLINNNHDFLYEFITPLYIDHFQ